MADQNHHSRTISEFQARYGSFQSRFTCRNYTNSGFQTSLLVANPSRGFFVQAPSEREFVGTLGSNLFWASLSSALSKAIADTVMRKTFTEEDREMMEQPKKPTKGMGIRERWSIRIQNLRSSTLSVIRYVPTPALNFVLKDYFKTLFDFNKDRDSHLVWFNFISGGGAGASTLILMHSLDLAWKRLAKDEAKKVRERQFTGLIDVYRKTLASNGIAGLYRGFNISCIGVVIYRSLYFGIYDSLKPVVLTGSLRDSYYATAALALLATSCASLASYPIDTVRSRMMMTSGEIVKYKSSLDAFTQIIKNEGAKSLFKSYRTALIPVMTAASVLAFYDRLQKPIVDAKRKKRLSDESEQVAI